MESNRVEAEKCVEIAENCLRLGQIDKALRFLRKAEHLYPSKAATDLIARLTSDDSGKTIDNQDGAQEGEEPKKKRTTRAGNQNTANNNNASPCQARRYNDEQVHAVKRIRGCKDYYDILGVTRQCTDDDLKKAYKKLALKFHPDKNHAPGATDAFKIIVNALTVLSDPVKRRHYNEFGIDDERPRSPHFAPSYNSWEAGEQQQQRSPTYTSSYTSWGTREQQQKRRQTGNRGRSSDDFDFEFMRRFNECETSPEEFFRQFFDAAHSTASSKPTRPQKPTRAGSSHYTHRPPPSQQSSSTYQQSSYQQSSWQQSSWTTKESKASTRANPGSGGCPCPHGSPPSPGQQQQPFGDDRTGNGVKETKKSSNHGVQSGYSVLMDVSPLLFIAVLFLISVCFVKDVPVDSFHADRFISVARRTQMQRPTGSYYLNDDDGGGSSIADLDQEDLDIELLENECLKEIRTGGGQLHRATISPQVAEELDSDDVKDSGKACQLFEQALLKNRRMGKAGRKRHGGRGP